MTTKYAPTSDPEWTLDKEARFFATLDAHYPYKAFTRKGSGKVEPLSALEAALLREYATDTLDAKRLSGSYLTTLSAVMSKIANAERGRSDCTISQRDDRLGPRPTLRTIQAQLEVAGVLHRVTRTQGHGFVGEVFLYRHSRAYVPPEEPARTLERF